MTDHVTSTGGRNTEYKTPYFIAGMQGILIRPAKGVTFSNQYSSIWDKNIFTSQSLNGKVGFTT